MPDVRDQDTAAALCKLGLYSLDAIPADAPASRPLRNNQFAQVGLKPRSWAQTKAATVESSSHTSAKSPAVSMPFAKVASDQSRCQNPGSASISRRMAGRSSRLASRISSLPCAANATLSGRGEYRESRSVGA